MSFNPIKVFSKLHKTESNFTGDTLEVSLVTVMWSFWAEDTTLGTPVLGVAQSRIAQSRQGKPQQGNANMMMAKAGYWGNNITIAVRTDL